MKTDLWESKDPLIYVSTCVATSQFIFCGLCCQWKNHLLSYPGFCGVISCLTWSSGAGRGFKRSLSDADLVGNGCHSGEWPPMSLCGFDKDRDLCSSSIYGSGPLWHCLLRPAAISVSTSWEGGGYY